MTIPVTHNCSHQAEGWCLACVGNLGNEYDKLRQAASAYLEHHYCGNCGGGTTLWCKKCKARFALEHELRSKRVTGIKQPLIPEEYERVAKLVWASQPKEDAFSSVWELCSNGYIKFVRHMYSAGLFILNSRTTAEICPKCNNRSSADKPCMYCDSPNKPK